MRSHAPRRLAPLAVPSCLCAGLLIAISYAAAQQAPPAADKKDPNPPTAWSDPRVIAELMKNCRFEVTKDRPDWVGDIGAGSTHPLMCLSGRDQSCVPDPCFTDMDDKGCRARCEKTCDRCAGGCVTKCTTCKAACKDDACRKGCAESCASCQEGCVREVDRCSSGKCAKEYEECRARAKAAWKRNGCDAVCASARKSCEKGCTREKPDDRGWCVERCLMDKKSPDARCQLIHCMNQPEN